MTNKLPVAQGYRDLSLLTARPCSCSRLSSLVIVLAWILLFIFRSLLQYPIIWVYLLLLLIFLTRALFFINISLFFMSIYPPRHAVSGSPW